MPHHPTINISPSDSDLLADFYVDFIHEILMDTIQAAFYLFYKRQYRSLLYNMTISMTIFKYICRLFFALCEKINQTVV